MSQAEAETMTMLTNQSPAAAACDPTDPTLWSTFSSTSIVCFQCQAKQAGGTISKLWLAHPDQQAGFFSIENLQAGPL